MTKSAPSHAEGQAGFTLIEIVVVMAVMGLVIGGLSVALIGTWHNSDATFQRLAKSHDAQLLAGYLVNDAQSSGGSTNGVSNVSLTDTTTCSDPSIVDGSTYSIAPVLMMKWYDTTGSGSPTMTSKAVDYVLVTNKNLTAPYNTTLMRRYCVGPVLTSDTTVLHYVQFPTGNAHMAACTPNPDCSGTPQTVTVNVTETKAAYEVAPYTFSLTGEFRQVPPGGTAPVLPPQYTNVSWLTLGSDASCTGSPYNFAASTDLGGNGEVNIAGSNPKLISDGTISTSPNVQINPGGTTKVQNAGIPDPLSLLPAPTSATQYSSGSIVGPGEYTNAVSITSEKDLSSGIYIFDNGLSISGNAEVSNDSGGVLIYLAGGALTVSGKADVALTPMSSGAYQNILIFQSRTNTSIDQLVGNGVASYGTASHPAVVYIPNGAFETSGNGSETSLDGSVIAKCAQVKGNGELSIGPPAAL